MKEKCKDCGKCCFDTEMMLSNEDISRILYNYPQNLQKEDFVIENDHISQLKNIEGYCVFFDISSKICKIYPSRPQGCRYYPLIYDINKKTCVYDDECPRIHLFYQSNDEFEELCQQVREFVKTHLNLDI